MSNAQKLIAAKAAPNPAEVVEQEVRMATIMFVDVRNSSEISNVLSLEDYDAFINEFQVLARDAVENRLAEINPTDLRDIEYSIRGDELFFINYVGTDEEALLRNIETIMHIAFDLKRKWMFSSTNRKRIAQGKMIDDIGMGIHIGEVIVGHHPGRDFPRTAEGWAINLTKKIEGLSRKGNYSKIMVSEGVFRRARRTALRVYFTPRSTVWFDGIGRYLPVYEVKGYKLPSTAQSTDEEFELLQRAFLNNPCDLWLGSMVGAVLYQRGNFRGAMEFYRDTLEIEPTYVPGLFSLALCSYHLGDIDRAAEICQEALRHEPDYTDAHYLLGLYYARTGDFAREVAAYQHALLIDPSQGPPRLNMVESLLLQGKVSDALVAAEEGVDSGLTGAELLLCRFLYLLSAALENDFRWTALADQVLDEIQTNTVELEFDFADCRNLVEEQLEGERRQRLLQIIELLEPMTVAHA
ncbi:MAG: adenylate/guanylate cyclase domain-containing protein [Armatimonadota bacterium]